MATYWTRWVLEDGTTVDQEITEEQYQALRKGESPVLTPPVERASRDLGGRDIQIGGSTVKGLQPGNGVAWMKR